MVGNVKESFSYGINTCMAEVDPTDHYARVHVLEISVNK